MDGHDNKESINLMPIKKTRKRKLHSEGMHPNSKRNNMKLRKISPHMSRPFKPDFTKFKQEAGGISNPFEGIIGFFQTFKMRRQIKAALKDAGKIKSSSKELETLTSEYTRSVLRYEGEINKALSLANEYIVRFRERTMLAIISKNYKPGNEKVSKIDVIKSHPRDEAVEKMKQVDIEMSQLSTELKAIDTMIEKQQKKLGEIQLKYEKKTKIYFKTVETFAEKSGGPYQRFNQKKEYIGKLRGKLDTFTEKSERAKVDKEIRKFEAIEPLVDELLEKNKTYRDNASQKLAEAQKKRATIKYFDDQFARINEFKNSFIKKTGNTLHKSLEDMFKLLMEVAGNQKEIHKGLDASKFGMDNLFNKLFIEKKQYLVHLLDTVKNMRTDINDFMALENGISKLGNKTISYFFEQKPVIVFKMNFNGIIEGRNKLRESLDILVNGVETLIFTLDFIKKNDMNSVKEYFQWLLDNRFKKLTQPSQEKQNPSRDTRGYDKDKGDKGYGSGDGKGYGKGYDKGYGDDRDDGKGYGKGYGRDDGNRYGRDDGRDDGSNPNPNFGRGRGDGRGDGRGGRGRGDGRGRGNGNMGRKGFTGGYIGDDQVGGVLDDASIKSLRNAVNEMNGNNFQLQNPCTIKLLPSNMSTNEIVYNYLYQMYDNGRIFESKPSDCKIDKRIIYNDKYHYIAEPNAKVNLNGKEYALNPLGLISPNETQVITYANNYNSVMVDLGLENNPQYMIPKLSFRLLKSAEELSKNLSKSLEEKKTFHPSYEPYVCPFTQYAIFPNTTYLVKDNLVNMATGIEFDKNFSYNGDFLMQNYGFSESMVQKIINGDIKNIKNINLFPRVESNKSITTPCFTNRSVHEIAFTHALMNSSNDTPMATKPFSAVQFNEFENVEANSYQMFHLGKYDALTGITIAGKPNSELIKSLPFVPNAYLSHLAMEIYQTQKEIPKIINTLNRRFNIIEIDVIQIADAATGDDNFIKKRTLGNFFEVYDNSDRQNTPQNFVLRTISAGYPAAAIANPNNYDFFYSNAARPPLARLREQYKSVYTHQKKPVELGDLVTNTFFDRFELPNDNVGNHSNLYLLSNESNEFLTSRYYMPIQNSLLFFNDIITKSRIDLTIDGIIMDDVTAMNTKMINETDPKKLTNFIRNNQLMLNHKSKIAEPSANLKRDIVNELTAIGVNNFAWLKTLIGIAAAYNVAIDMNRDNNIMYYLMDNYVSDVPNDTLIDNLFSNEVISTDVSTIYYLAKTIIDLIGLYGDGTGNTIIGVVNRNNQLKGFMNDTHTDFDATPITNNANAVKSLVEFGYNIFVLLEDKNHNDNAIQLRYNNKLNFVLDATKIHNIGNDGETHYFVNETAGKPNRSDLTGLTIADRNALTGMIIRQRASWDKILNNATELLKQVALKENILLYVALEYQANKKFSPIATGKDITANDLPHTELIPIPRTIYCVQDGIDTPGVRHKKNNVFRFNAILVDGFTLNSQLYSFSFGKKPPILLAGKKSNTNVNTNRMDIYYLSFKKNPVAGKPTERTHLTLVKSDLNTGHYEKGGRIGIFNNHDILYPVKDHTDLAYVNYHLSSVLNINNSPRLFCKNPSETCALPIMYPNTLMFTDATHAGNTMVNVMPQNLQIGGGIIGGIHDKANMGLHNEIFNGTFAGNTVYNTVADVDGYTYSELTYDHLGRGYGRPLTSKVDELWLSDYNKFTYLVGFNKYHSHPNHTPDDITINSHPYISKIFGIQIQIQNKSHRKMEDEYANSSNGIAVRGFESLVPIYVAKDNQQFSFFRHDQPPVNKRFKNRDYDYPIVHEYSDYADWLALNPNVANNAFNTTITDTQVKNILSMHTQNTVGGADVDFMKGIYGTLIDKDMLHDVRKFLGYDLWGHEYTSRMENVYCDINLHPIILQPFSTTAQITFQKHDYTFITPAEVNAQNQLAVLNLHRAGNPYVKRNHVMLENIFNFDTYVANDHLFYEASDSIVKAYPKDAATLIAGGDYSKTFKMYTTDPNNIRHDLLPALLDNHYYYLCKGYNYHIDNMDKFMEGFEKYAVEGKPIDNHTKGHMKFVIDALNFTIYDQIIIEMGKDGNNINTALKYNEIKPVLLYQYLFGAMKFVKRFSSIIGDYPSLLKRIQFIRNNYLKKPKTDQTPTDTTKPPTEQPPVQQTGGVGLAADIISSHLKANPSKIFENKNIDISGQISVLNQYLKEIHKFLERVVQGDAVIEEIKNIVRKPMIDALLQWYNSLPEDGEIDENMAAVPAVDITSSGTSPGSRVKLPDAISDKAEKIIVKDDFLNLRMANSLEQMISLIIDPNKPLAFEDLKTGADISLKLLRENILPPLKSALGAIDKYKKDFVRWNDTIEKAVMAELAVNAIELSGKDPKLKDVSLEQQDRLTFKIAPGDMEDDVKELEALMTKSSFGREKILKPLSVGDKNIMKFTTIPGEKTESSDTTSTRDVFDRAVGAKDYTSSESTLKYAELIDWTQDYRNRDESGKYVPANIKGLLTRPDFIKLLASDYSLKTGLMAKRSINEIICRSGTHEDDINNLFDQIGREARADNRGAFETVRNMCLANARKKDNNQGKGKGQQQGQQQGQHKGKHGKGKYEE